LKLWHNDGNLEHDIGILETVTETGRLNNLLKGERT